jgi:hypothetical protein
MAQIESTPFLFNTAYGLYNDKQMIIKNRYFKILEVIKDEREDDLQGGIIRTLTVQIEYKKNSEQEPMVIIAYISKSSEENHYKLFHNGGVKGILIPNLVVSTEPLLNQGGGHRNRKSTKRVRRRRRNKTTGRRSTY